MLSLMTTSQKSKVPQSLEHLQMAGFWLLLKYEPLHNQQICLQLKDVPPTKGCADQPKDVLYSQ